MGVEDGVRWGGGIHGGSMLCDIKVTAVIKWQYLIHTELLYLLYPEVFAIPWVLSEWNHAFLILDVCV